MPLEFKQPKSICVFFSDQQKKESGAIDSADKEILAEAERLDVRAMGPLILSELLFDENIRDQIKKYKRHFLRVCIKKSFNFKCDRPAHTGSACTGICETFC